MKSNKTSLVCVLWLLADSTRIPESLLWLFFLFCTACRFSFSVPARKAYYSLLQTASKAISATLEQINGDDMKQ